MRSADNLTVTTPELSAVAVPVSPYGFSRGRPLTVITASAAVRKLQGFPPSAAACQES